MKRKRIGRKICSVEGCGKKVFGRGLCSAHYSKLWRSKQFKKIPVRTGTICDAKGCTRIIDRSGGNGYCSMHYQRFKKHGNPDIVNWKELEGSTVEEKLSLNYKVNKNGCWIWQGAVTSKGYGSIQIGDGKTESVHRLAYELWVGEIPEGLHVLHKCDTPKCINPDHLFAGTNQDNVTDKINKGRAFTGNHKGEKNENSKLTNGKISRIKKMIEKGNFNQTEIGKMFDVSRQTICGINRGKRWKHLNRKRTRTR